MSGLSCMDLVFFPSIISSSMVGSLFPSQSFAHSDSSTLVLDHASLDPLIFPRKMAHLDSRRPESSTPHVWRNSTFRPCCWIFESCSIFRNLAIFRVPNPKWLCLKVRGPPNLSSIVHLSTWRIIPVSK